MIKIKPLISSILLIISIPASADLVNYGQKVCEKMSSPVDREKCKNSIGPIKYFNREASDFCYRGMVYAKNTIICLQTIGNKTYLLSEIENCSNKSFFPDERIECLSRRGMKITKASSPEFIHSMHALDEANLNGILTEPVFPCH